MRIHFFTKGDKNVPSSRYRGYYLADCLNSMGHHAIVTPATDHSVNGFFSYLRTLMTMDASEVLFLQRTIYNRYFLAALFIAWLFGRRFIFDIDDAVYEHSNLKTKVMTKYATFVTCGSERIKSWTMEHNEKSFVLSNSVPLSIYTKRDKVPVGLPVIGWIGTMPEHFMVSVIPALETLASRGEKFAVKVIGAMGNPKISELLKNVPNTVVIDSLDWANPNEAVEEIKQFTIGIMPLTENEWDQAKYFKALEYMACSVPVVATAAETVSQILKSSRAGFTASSTSEWVEKLSLLLNDEVLRTEMGQRGRVNIEERYSTQARTKDLLGLLTNNQND